MEGHSVELDAVREEDHRAEDTVSKTSKLGGGSLGFVFKEVWKALEAHDLSRKGTNAQ